MLNDGTAIRVLVVGKSANQAFRGFPYCLGRLAVQHKGYPLNPIGS